MALGLPVIGGNVSLYNESGGVDIDPTPVIGALGLIDRLAARPPGVHPGRRRPPWSCSTPAWVPPAGRPSPPSLAGSRWAVECRGHRNGTLPALDLAGHRGWSSSSRGLVAEAGRLGGATDPVLSGIHDVSGGGLGVALAEMAVRSGVGLQVAGVADHHELFTEAPVPGGGVHHPPQRADHAGGRRPASASGCSATAGGDRLVVDGPGRPVGGRGHRRLAGPAARRAGRAGPGRRRSERPEAEGLERGSPGGPVSRSSPAGSVRRRAAGPRAGPAPGRAP